MQNNRIISLLIAGFMAGALPSAASPGDLSKLPAQPEGTAWPSETWPASANPDTALKAFVASGFADDAPDVLQDVRAVLVVHRGQIVAEQYRGGFTQHTKLVSWSMGKSMVHALAGIKVMDGSLALDAPLPVPEWQERSGDPRQAITLDHALHMATGLEYAEDYVNLADSDVIEMLYGDGYADMGHFVASKPLAHEPGTHWSYSSGTTNLISRVLRDLSGGTEEAYRAFMDKELFGPLGMRNYEAEFDGAGTFIGSSLIFMTARDYARFGLLYMRDGMWQGRRLLPEGWVDHARTEKVASKGRYGAHWWLDGYADPQGVANSKITFPADTFMARGHEEQSIIIIPSKDVIIVCLSLVTDPDVSPLRDYLGGIAAMFPDIKN